jgi:hypothetical protein
MIRPAEKRDMPEKPWYIRMRGKVLGPFGLERLREFRDEGQLQPFHEVSQDQITWEPLARLDGLFRGQTALASLPPAPNRVGVAPLPPGPSITVSPAEPPQVPRQPAVDYSLSGWFGTPKNVALLTCVCLVLALACWAIVTVTRGHDKDKELADLRQDLETRTAEVASRTNELQGRDEKLEKLLARQKAFDAQATEQDKLEQQIKSQQADLEKLRKELQAEPPKVGDDVAAKALEAAEQARKAAEEARAASDKNAQRKDKVILALKDGLKGADKLVAGIEGAAKGDVDPATLKDIVGKWLDAQAASEFEARGTLDKIKENMAILERSAMKKRSEAEEKAFQVRKEAVEKMANTILEKSLSGTLKKQADAYLEQLKKL